MVPFSISNNADRAAEFPHISSGFKHNMRFILFSSINFNYSPISAPIPQIAVNSLRGDILQRTARLSP